MKESWTKEFLNEPRTKTNKEWSVTDCRDLSYEEYYELFGIIIYTRLGLYKPVIVTEAIRQKAKDILKKNGKNLLIIDVNEQGLSATYKYDGNKSMILKPELGRLMTVNEYKIKYNL